MPTIEQSIGKWLIDLGITHVYGVGAVPMHDTYRHCAKNGLNLIGTHEQRAAVLMAACHNYLAGKQLACVIVSMGPSVTNTVTGAYTALGNQWPVMIISNSVAQDHFFPGMFQSYDAIPAMASVTKRSIRVASKEDCQNCLTDAYETASSCPRGPVYIDIPTPLLTQTVQTQCRRADVAPTEPHEITNVNQFLSAMTSASRPLLLLGQNIRWNDDYLIVRSLIETHEIPFVTVPLSRGFIPETHVLCATRNATQAQAESDLVIVIGGALDWKLRFGVAINPHATIYQFGTDPLAPFLDRNILTIDASISQLQHTIVESEFSDDGSMRDSDWIQSVTAGHQSAFTKIKNQHANLFGPINSYSIAIAASRTAEPETLFIIDANTTMRAADLCLEPTSPLTHITAGHTGLMGGGIPYGIASLVENRNRPVIVICGDFAFGQSAMELETAARKNLPLVILLVNNQACSEGIFEFEEYTSPFTSFCEGIAYESICKAFGGNGVVVDQAEALPDAISEAVKKAEASSKPYLLNINVTERLGMPPRL